MKEPASLLSSSLFERRGYLLIPNLVEPAVAKFLTCHVQDCIEYNRVRYGDSQVADAPNGYGDGAMEALLLRLLHRIEGLLDRRLYPSYSYYRVYRHGDALERHKDREACEISVSITLDYEAENRWPLWVGTPGGAQPIEIPRCSGLLYEGTEVPHWREPFAGKWAIQTFLHYVDQNGPYAEHRFDQERQSRETATSLSKQEITR